MLSIQVHERFYVDTVSNLFVTSIFSNCTPMKRIPRQTSKNADIQFLSPAPITRRGLLLHKILRAPSAL